VLVAFLDYGGAWYDDQKPRSRWTVVFGSSFVFPRRTIPTISYQAQPPP
jgi:hypothetical protein